MCAREKIDLILLDRPIGEESAVFEQDVIRVAFHKNPSVSMFFLIFARRRLLLFTEFDNIFPTIRLLGLSWK
jgi:hypothetical protein